MSTEDGPGLVLQGWQLLAVAQRDAMLRGVAIAEARRSSPGNRATLRARLVGLVENRPEVFGDLAPLTMLSWWPSCRRF